MSTGAVPSGAPAIALPLLLPSQSSQTCTITQVEPFTSTKVVSTCTWDRAAPSCAPSGADAAAKPSLLAPRRRAWRSSCGPSSSAGGSVEAARTLAASIAQCYAPDLANSRGCSYATGHRRRPQSRSSGQDTPAQNMNASWVAKRVCAQRESWRPSGDFDSYCRIDHQ